MTTMVSTIWLRRWWIVVPSLLTAFVTHTATAYFLAARDWRADIRLMTVRSVPREDQFAASSQAARGFPIRKRMSTSEIEDLVAHCGAADRDINVNILVHDPLGGDIRAEGTARINGAKQ